MLTRDGSVQPRHPLRLDVRGRRLEDDNGLRGRHVRETRRVARDRRGDGVRRSGSLRGRPRWADPLFGRGRHLGIAGSGPAAGGRGRSRRNDTEVVHGDGVCGVRQDLPLCRRPVQGHQLGDGLERRRRHVGEHAHRGCDPSDRGRPDGAVLVAGRQPAGIVRRPELPGDADRARSRFGDRRLHAAADPGRGSRRCAGHDRRGWQLVSDGPRRGGDRDPRDRGRSQRARPRLHRAGRLGIRHLDRRWRHDDPQRTAAGVRRVRRRGRSFDHPGHRLPRDRTVLVQHRRDLVQPRPRFRPSLDERRSRRRGGGHDRPGWR